MTRHLALESYSVFREQLSASFLFDGYRFSTTYWYDDLSFESLETQYGKSFLEKVIFHVIAFEINKFASLAPASLSFGPLQHHVTAEFSDLWKKIFQHVWGQWRFENALPDYSGPTFDVSGSDATIPALEIESGEVRVLAFCGGGKDSLVAAKLLERAGIPFSSLAYSSSIYGQAQAQQALIDGLLDHTSAVVRHKQWVFDDFLDSPILRFAGGGAIRSLCAAETPSSIFGVLPFVLAKGYDTVVLGHEKSADKGNMVWEETGEAINHQWGKSYEAEMLLCNYIKAHLISNVTVGSILKPIHDVLIFNLLKQDEDAVKQTHSCNLQKPWCKKCPKCAYVWLNYMAYLPTALVDGIFHENLFDLEENQIWFRQLLGLEAHTPFECVGQPEEAQIAFELCRRKGLSGRAMDAYVAHFPTPDFRPHVAELLSIDAGRTALPASLMDGVVVQMNRIAAAATTDLLDRLSPKQ